MGASYGKQKMAAKRKLNIGRFTAIPHMVIHSQEYRALGFAARALLFDVAAQFNGQNNGKLVCCTKYLKPLGWKSNDTITRALRELIQSGLLIQTRQGMKPPCAQAAWFAIGWLSLDVQVGIDIINPKQYQRSKLTQIGEITPVIGAVTPKTTPTSGVGFQFAIPAIGAVNVEKAPVTAPIAGAYIDLPSTVSTSSSNHQQKNIKWSSADACADTQASALIH